MHSRLCADVAATLSCCCCCSCVLFCFFPQSCARRLLQSGSHKEEGVAANTQHRRGKKKCCNVESLLLPGVAWNQLFSWFPLKPKSKGGGGALPLLSSWVAMMTDQLAWLISFGRALEIKAVAGWTGRLWVFSLCYAPFYFFFFFCIIDWELMAEAAVIKRVRNGSTKTLVMAIWAI